MSIKKQLLAEINKKASKIRERRVEAASNKTLESYIFEFFRNIEESRQLHGGKKYDETLFSNAKKSLERCIRTIDRHAKISVEFNVSDDLSSWEEQLVRGVTIWWGQAHIIHNNVDPSLYIDVTQTLFF